MSEEGSNGFAVLRGVYLNQYCMRTLVRLILLKFLRDRVNISAKIARHSSHACCTYVRLICLERRVDELHHLRETKVVRLAQEEGHLVLVVQRQVEIAAVPEKVEHVAKQFAATR